MHLDPENPLADPFAILTSTIESINPALLTTSPPSLPPFLPLPDPIPAPYAIDYDPEIPTQDLVPAAHQIAFHDPFAPRAQSEPPEQRSQPRHPYPAALRKGRGGYRRQHPYQRASPSPTSGLGALERAGFCEQRPLGDCTRGGDQTALALGVQMYLERIVGACNEMRALVGRGFGGGGGGGDGRGEVEK